MLTSSYSQHEQSAYVPTLWYQNSKAYLLPGGNEGRSKSTFRQLRISTLWTSKVYVNDIKCKNRPQIMNFWREILTAGRQDKMFSIQQLDLNLSQQDLQKFRKSVKNSKMNFE